MRGLAILALTIWGGCAATEGAVAAAVDMASSASVDAASPIDAAQAIDVANAIDAAQVAPSDAAQSMMCSDDIALPGVAGCQFYACRDAEHPCGADGYYLGFAEKYCERFLTDLAPQMSSAGQAFLSAARDCLMHYVNDHVPVDLSCDEVKTDGLASHVDCYVDNGFCDIPLTDKAALFLAIDPADRDFLAMVETGINCF